MEEQNDIMAALKEGFDRIDQRFGRLEDDVSVLKTDTNKALLKLEFLIGQADLIKENVVDMRTYMARYHDQVEHPLEERVVRLEARVGILEGKK